jgi:hypothetical protein
MFAGRLKDKQVSGRGQQDVAWIDFPFGRQEYHVNLVNPVILS